MMRLMKQCNTRTISLKQMRQAERIWFMNVLKKFNFEYTEFDTGSELFLIIKLS